MNESKIILSSIILLIILCLILGIHLEEVDKRCLKVLESPELSKNIELVKKVCK